MPIESTDPLERRRSSFIVFAMVDCPDFPLYRSLCLGIAEDDALLDLLSEAKGGQSRPNLLLAALHDLVLQYPDEDLSRYYPTTGGAFSEGTDPMPALRRFVEQHSAELAAVIATRSTQTNEVNRSCLWFAAVRAAIADLPDRPIALVEVGASAGLNLGIDRYCYQYIGPDGTVRIAGNALSPVSLECNVRRGHPPLEDQLPPIVTRVGLDLNPVNLLDPQDRRWLKACIWPEQAERHRRFEAAVAESIAHPPRIVIDDAVDGISELIEDQPHDAHVVIISSWVMAYLRRDRRAAFDAAVDLAARDRNVTWISAEGSGVVDFVPASPVDPEEHTVVGMASWRTGARNGVRADSLLARCHPHLTWMEWLG